MNCSLQLYNTDPHTLNWFEGVLLSPQLSEDLGGACVSRYTKSILQIVPVSSHEWIVLYLLRENGWNLKVQ